MRGLSTLLVTFLCALVLTSWSVCWAGQDVWTTNGPYGGSIGGFAFHPQNADLIFASRGPEFATGQGFYRSKNGGKTWERLDVPAGIPLIHPKNPERIYNLPFTSTDQGKTWQQLGLPETFFDAKLHPTNPRILYAAAASGVFKSTDGGSTWLAKNKGLSLVADFLHFAKIEVAPSNGNVVYVLFEGSPRVEVVFRSTDGAESWKQVKGLGRSIAIDPKNSQVVYQAGFSGHYKSTNGGKSWFPLNCGVCGNVDDITIDPNNSNIIYTPTAKSTDGGNTWVQLRVHPMELKAVEVHPKVSSLLFIGGWGQGIFRSQNAGGDWRPVNSRVNSFPVEHVRANERRLIAASGPTSLFGQLFQSLNGGKQWKDISIAGATYDVQLHEEDPNLIVLAGDFGGNTVAISKDGGINWQRKAPFIVVLFILIDPDNPKILYLANPPWTVGTFSGVMKSTNQGDSWQLMNSGLANTDVTAFQIDPSNGSRLFVGTGIGDIYRTADGAKSWKRNTTILPGAEVRSIAVDPRNSNVVFSSIGGSLFKSTDGGQTWSEKTGPDDCFAVAVDPSDSTKVYAGVPGALLISIDGGESWTSFDNRGLAPFEIYDFIKDPNQPDTFLIGTERGVYSFSRKGSAGFPVIEALSPNVGKTGDSIKISGRNFGAVQGDSKVSFTGADAGAAQSWSQTGITVAVPSGARSGPITVTVANRKSNGSDFILLPSSGNLEPASGPASGGTRVAILAPSGISGTQFNVLFGSTLARNVGFIPPNIIICTTPPGSGSVEVSVTTSAVVTKVGTFSYQ